MPEPKDVIIGVLGASGGLAGLLLVFIGFIFAQAASFPSTTDNRIIRRYERAARLGVYPFLGFLVTTVLAVLWLLNPSPRIFRICVDVFIALVAGTGLYGALASFRYL